MTITKWKRAKLTGTLTVTSPLHIGDGNTEPRNNASGDEVLENSICRDAHGKPYIPASTLRGALKALFKSGVQKNTLFGYSGLGNQNGQMGALRCYDATSSKQIDPDKDKISRTKINSYLGTAEQHHLFTTQVVPVGFTFSIQIELDDVSETNISCLIAAIELLNESGNGLGRGKRTGKGRLSWTLDNLDVIDQEQIKHWLTSESSALTWKAVTHFPQADYEHCVSLAQQTIDFKIKFNSPWLINDPSLVNKNKNTPESTEPNLEFSRQGDKALLPATSLKGWLRNRGLKILHTLLDSHRNAEQIANAWVEEAFGNTQKASWITISDALSSSPVVDGQVHSFNAIDRFTGGVKDKALYFVRAAPPCEVTGLFGITSFDDLTDWRLALLLLILRDAMEGDLVLGWGKAKGFGQASLSLSIDSHTFESWEQIKNHLGAAMHPPLKALSKKIQTELNSHLQDVAHV